MPMNERAKKVWEAHYGRKPGVKDPYGTWIEKTAYGDENSKFGWDLDHIVPKSRGGTNAMSNLRPMHYSNNRARGNR